MEETSKDINDLLNDGLILSILKEIANILPYQCKSCLSTVQYWKNETPTVTCRSCNIGACQSCYSRSDDNRLWSFICPPCGEEVDLTRSVPDFMKRSDITLAGVISISSCMNSISSLTTFKHQSVFTRPSQGKSGGGNFGLLRISSFYQVCTATANVLSFSSNLSSLL